MIPKKINLIIAIICFANCAVLLTAITGNCFEATVRQELVIHDKTDKYKSAAFAEIGAYDNEKKEFRFTANESPHKYCWRLVHDGKKVIVLVESSGVTTTLYELYCGTEMECRAEIKRLNLDIDNITFQPPGLKKNL